MSSSRPSRPHIAASSSRAEALGIFTVSQANGEVGRARAFPASAAGRQLYTAALGVSVDSTCGVRDHAVLLAEALEREDVSCSLHWLWREGGSLGASRSEIRAWTADLGTQLDRARLDAVLLHYSVFAYSYRGLPLFVHPIVATLRKLRIPLVSVLHEYAFPWGQRGLRGTSWASTQRALLVDVMRASTAVVVTADFRAEWLSRQAWLPKRRVVVAPVFSNLPAPTAGRPPTRSRYAVGLFGYSNDGVRRSAAMSRVLDALLLLEERDWPVELRLLGAPGRDSAVGHRWLEAARSRRLSNTPSFSGTLAAQDLSNALAACDILLFTEPPGPTSRKTTLAASLASGRPVVALDGPYTWPELTAFDAALVVPPTPALLADGLARLLEDEEERERLGARGRSFARRAMSVERSADAIARLLQDVVSSAN
jgi:glycosyltransferase involved in cell wall biosynthesis